VSASEEQAEAGGGLPEDEMEDVNAPLLSHDGAGSAGNDEADEAGGRLRATLRSASPLLQRSA
jgi:hypothetical protein